MKFEGKDEEECECDEEGEEQEEDFESETRREAAKGHPARRKAMRTRRFQSVWDRHHGKDA